MCDPVKLLKLERATAQLWKPMWTSDEKNIMEVNIGDLVEDSVYANYFLAYLHSKLTSTNSNQLRLEHEGFVFLKDKFLKMLSSRRSVYRRNRFQRCEGIIGRVDDSCGLEDLF